MPRLTEYTKYDDAQKYFSKEALWQLFDGNKNELNISYECLDRHPRINTAVRICYEKSPSRSISFGELIDNSNRFANWLLHKGKQKGDRIAIMLDPSIEFYTALFGTMKAGCVAVPLFTAFGPDGLTARLKDCQPSLLILAPEKSALSSAVKIETVIGDRALMEELDCFDDEFISNTHSSDMAMYQYTSGTSRELPEAVKHRHRAIVTVMIAALYATGVRPGDKYMCPSSPAWGHGLWHGTLAPLALGIEIATYSGKFDPDRLLGALEEFETTNLSAAATHYRMMRNLQESGPRNFKINKLSFTGEPLDTETAIWAKKQFGHDVCSIYGSTEVGVIIANYPGADDLPVKLGSLGKPLPGCKIDIQDANGLSCSVGAIGEIKLFKNDTWFPVKDLGSFDKDGYYFHHGRADDVIISAGWTMSAVEIEDVLLKHKAVEEVAVIGVPEEERGQIVKAFVITKSDEKNALAKELQTFTRERLSLHEYPRIIEFVETLPKTPAGKVNRKALRESAIKDNERDL